MATFLLVAISVIFIGLGIPDSILGAAWPAIYTDLNILESSQGLCSMIVAACTILSSFFSAKIINRFGIGIVTAISTLLTAVALIGNSFATSLIWLCVFAVPAGFGAGAIDAGLNNYVALRYKPSHMSFLHCFYGMGVAASPYIMSFALSLSNNWRLGFRTVFFMQLIIVAITFVALPFWDKVKVKTNSNKVFKPITLSYITMLKTPSIRIGWVAFFSSVSLEFTCGVWACTYFAVNGLSAGAAAKYLTLYYLGVTIGRFVSGLLNLKLKNITVIKIGYTIVCAAIILIMLPIPLTIKGIALFFIGFGNGPTFPNLVSMTPSLFGEERSQSIVGSWLVMSNLGVLLVPSLFGLLAQFLSFAIFPYFIFMCFVFMLVSTYFFIKTSKNAFKNTEMSYSATPNIVDKSDDVTIDNSANDDLTDSGSTNDEMSDNDLIEQTKDNPSKQQKT